MVVKTSHWALAKYLASPRQWVNVYHALRHNSPHNNSVHEGYYYSSLIETWRSLSDLNRNTEQGNGEMFSINSMSGLKVYVCKFFADSRHYEACKLSFCVWGDSGFLRVSFTCQHYALHIVHLLPLRQVIITPFCRWRKWILKGLSHLLIAICEQHSLEKAETVQGTTPFFSASS